MFVGVDYYPEHWPQTRWAKDARLMREAGFNGYYAIEREVGADPVGDIRKAVGFLKTL